MFWVGNFGAGFRCLVVLTGWKKGLNDERQPRSRDADVCDPPKCYTKYDQKSVLHLWVYSGRSSVNTRSKSKNQSGAAHVFQCSLSAGLNVELFVNVLQVHPHCIEADAERATDFLVKRAFGEQGEDFLLARCKLLHVR